ncbi:MAG: DUF99 family protein [Candidatus Micrarchaeia archaeon]
MDCKYGIRIAAITSGPLSSKTAFVSCVIYRSGIIEGLLSTNIEVNGSNSTSKLARMFRKSRFSQQIRILAFNGIALAGLNVVDVYKLSGMLRAGFVIATRKKPRKELLLEALDAFASKKGEDVSFRKAIVERVSSESIAYLNGFYFQGIYAPDSTMAARIIEALRISHIISRGVSTGESKGRL